MSTCTYFNLLNHRLCKNNNATHLVFMLPACIRRRWLLLKLIIHLKIYKGTYIYIFRLRSIRFREKFLPASFWYFWDLTRIRQWCLIMLGPHRYIYFSLMSATTYYKLFKIILLDAFCEIWQSLCDSRTYKMPICNV